MFVGYGNPSAQLLIVGQEVTWNKEEQASEFEHYCLQNMEHWAKEIFPYLYGFEKKNFKPNGWFSTYKQDSKLYVCTWQFSAPLISDTMLQELANIIRRHLKQE